MMQTGESLKSDLMTLLAGRVEQAVEGGYALRLLSAFDVLQARRAAVELAAQTEEAGSLCANACLLSGALHWEGARAFPDGEAVLRSLTPSQIEDLAGQFAQFNRRENPSPQDGEERLDSLKKA